MAARFTGIFSGAGNAFMHEFRVNFPNARFRKLSDSNLRTAAGRFSYQQPRPAVARNAFQPQLMVWFA
jgi:hypothetical protein